MRAEIHLEESLNINAGPKGEIVSTHAKGILSIINPSNSTTLWGISLKANKKEDVKELNEETIPHIEAGKQYVQDYVIDISPRVEISEIVDTNYNQEEINPNNRDLVFNVDQTLAFKITIKNNYEFDLKNITLEKHLPPDTREIRAIEPYLGEVSINEEERTVVWTIPELKAGNEAAIIIASLCHPTTVQPYKTGLIVFKCEAVSKLSSLIPTIDGDCDNVDLSVKSSESTAPNQWQIDIGLRNASEFEIFLKKVEIDVNGERKFSDEPNQELESVLDEPIWKNSIIVESETYPEITKNFEYYVLYDITEHSVISYEKENDELFVVKVSATKYYDPPSVVTYAVTDLVEYIDITNTGTANVGKIEVEDTIPPYIEVESVTAETADTSLDVEFLERPKKQEQPIPEEQREKATFELIEQQQEEKPKEPVIVPVEEEDISKERKYHYRINNVTIEPGKMVKIKVVAKANKPKIDGTQLSPAVIKAYAVSPTVAYTTEAEFEGKEPRLEVEFKKRSYSITSIFKKAAEGEFSIEIPVSNTGEVPLDNVIIIQPIFNAEYISHSPPTVDVSVEGSNVKCHVKRINIGETITITLNVKTEGPIRQQQATIRIED